MNTGCGACVRIAHPNYVRRRFYELAASGSAAIVGEVLNRIAELYRIEDEIRSQTQDEHRAMRQGQ